MRTYEEAVEAVATCIAKLKLTGIDNYYLAKAVGDVAYDYKVDVMKARSDVMARVDVLVDMLAV